MTSLLATSGRKVLDKTQYEDLSGKLENLRKGQPGKTKADTDAALDQLRKDFGFEKAAFKPIDDSFRKGEDLRQTLKSILEVKIDVIQKNRLQDKAEKPHTAVNFRNYGKQLEKTSKAPGKAAADEIVASDLTLRLESDKIVVTGEPAAGSAAAHLKDTFVSGELQAVYVDLVSPERNNQLTAGQRRALFKSALRSHNPRLSAMPVMTPREIVLAVQALDAIPENRWRDIQAELALCGTRAAAYEGEPDRELEVMLILKELAASKSLLSPSPVEQFNIEHGWQRRTTADQAIDAIIAFARAIRGLPRTQLEAETLPLAEGSEFGDVGQCLTQKWLESCGPTAGQILAGIASPASALRLHTEGLGGHSTKTSHAVAQRDALEAPVFYDANGYFLKVSGEEHRVFDERGELPQGAEGVVKGRAVGSPLHQQREEFKLRLLNPPMLQAIPQGVAFHVYEVLFGKCPLDDIARMALEVLRARFPERVPSSEDVERMAALGNDAGAGMLMHVALGSTAARSLSTSFDCYVNFPPESHAQMFAWLRAYLARVGAIGATMTDAEGDGHAIVFCSVEESQAGGGTYLVANPNGRLVQVSEEEIRRGELWKKTGTAFAAAVAEMTFFPIAGAEPQ